MTDAHMIAMDGARAAVRAAPAGLRSTVRAVLWVFGGRGELAPVVGFVAGNAKCHPIGNIKHQFGIFCNWLYMMGVNISSFMPAFLAGVIISLVNRTSPFCKIAARLGAVAVKGFTTFPISCFIAHSREGSALAGAKAGALVSAIKNLPAMLAGPFLNVAASRPTIFRAITSGCGAVRFYLELLTTFLASVCDLCILHSFHYNTFSPAYVAAALERWATATGKTPVLVEHGRQ